MRAAARTWSREQLIYCSNVHPGESLDSVCGIVRDFVAPVARARGVARAGTGLWLSRAVAETLVAEPANLARFRAVLDETGVGLFSLNGFPTGGFHAEAVKARVYAPDWSTTERSSYTLALARILAACLLDDVEEGTISTLPLGFQPTWNPLKHERALDQLVRLADALDGLRCDTGHSIRVCLEMEPGCVLESTAQALHLFTTELPEAARRAGVPTATIERHLGLCYDVCHQAVMFEDAAASLAAIDAAGIALGKIQISSALEIPNPHASNVRAALNAFSEPRYLHQVRCRTADGGMHGVMDIPEAFAMGSGLPDGVPWRIHFHVPIHATTLAGGHLATTQNAIIETLGFLATRPGLHPHLEVETYTWQVLPEALRPYDDDQLIASLAAELGWLETALQRHGLLAS